MQEFTFMVIAYALAWVGLFAYLAFIVMRLHNVRTELAAVTELVQESQGEREIVQ